MDRLAVSVRQDSLVMLLKGKIVKLVSVMRVVWINATATMVFANVRKMLLVRNVIVVLKIIMDLIPAMDVRPAIVEQLLKVPNAI